MARLEFFAKWRAVASLNLSYAFPNFNNCLALKWGAEELQRLYKPSF